MEKWGSLTCPMGEKFVCRGAGDGGIFDSPLALSYANHHQTYDLMHIIMHILISLSVLLSKNGKQSAVLWTCFLDFIQGYTKFKIYLSYSWQIFDAPMLNYRRQKQYCK